MTRTALVTGAAGFIGSALVRSLSGSGVRVHGLDLQPAPDYLRSLIANWTVADISSGLPAGVERVDAVFHCAGGATVGASFDNPAADYLANVATTESVLGGVAGWADTRIVLVSSAAVYGNQSPAAIPESAELKPISPYAEHKRAAEERVRNSRLSVAVVRLFSVYGRGLRKQLLWDACQKFSRGASDFGGTGAEIRDWIHVDDAAALLVKAASVATPSCPVFNGGTGAPVAVRQVLEMLAQRLGCTAPLRFSGKARPGDPPAMVASVQAARAIGWAPTVSLGDGLSEYAKWFKSLSA